MLISQTQLIGSTWSTTFYGSDGHGSSRFLTEASGNGRPETSFINIPHCSEAPAPIASQAPELLLQINHSLPSPAFRVSYSRRDGADVYTAPSFAWVINLSKVSATVWYEPAGAL